MALATQIVGRPVRLTGVFTITTPTDPSFVLTSWCQLNLSQIAQQLGIPSTWNYAYAGVEVLNTSTVGGVTVYDARIHLAMT